MLLQAKTDTVLEFSLTVKTDQKLDSFNMIDSK